jgi:hypothetical protein
MIKNVLTHIGGIGMYGVISICIFFAVFLGVLIWMLTLKKSYLKSMGELPLHDDEPASANDSNLKSR